MACAAAVWGLAANEQSRALLLSLSVVEALLQVVRRSLTMPCGPGGQQQQPLQLAGDTCSQAQRNQLQVRRMAVLCMACVLWLAIVLPCCNNAPAAVIVFQAAVLGALSVLLVDRECRKPLIALEPGCDTLFSLCANLDGYADRVWAAARRETAAKAITSLVQRDHDARTQLMLRGGIHKVLELLETKVCARARERGACCLHLLSVSCSDCMLLMLCACWQTWHASATCDAAPPPPPPPRCRAPGTAACSFAWRRCWRRSCWTTALWSSSSSARRGTLCSRRRSSCWAT